MKNRAWLELSLRESANEFTAFDFRSLPVRLGLALSSTSSFFLFIYFSLFAGNSTKNFERKIIFIKRGVKFCLTSSISKFDISTIKKILVFSLPWDGWDFFSKIVNPKFLRAQRTFPFANSSHQLAMQISNDEERIELRNPTSTRSTFSKPLSSSRVEDCATAFLVSFSLPNPHCISKERAAGEFSPLE